MNGENYFFVKFDPNACFDATKYTGVQIDFTFPPNADFEITYTQAAPNCVDRRVDSVYKKLSDYIVPNGQPQSVFLPFSDFNRNINGTDFDLQHIKDLTFLRFLPSQVQYTFDKIELIAPCNAPQPPTPQPPTPQPSTPQSPTTDHSNNPKKINFIVPKKLLEIIPKKLDFIIPKKVEVITPKVEVTVTKDNKNKDSGCGIFGCRDNKNSGCGIFGCRENKESRCGRFRC
ncbi:hypothetical protein SeLEV6574_g01103 [Synchytrium endobioticum]|uniref:Uncharacterized protein n=1 Tax=Synchytrium endobioticum TaxID=286115 RepID=A0A507DFG2_9FUNG|nr:hypothetical protein SeLEV6574_g01103 [Synchytrium endobioticum]